MPNRYTSEKVSVAGQSYYMDGGLRTFLEKLRLKVEKRNKDGWMLVGGHEGDGKTTFAFQCATYIDPTFSLERVAFSGEQFIKMVRKAKPGQAVVYDEAVTGMASDETWKDINRKILRAAVLCRKRRLYIFICIPTIFLLRWYIAYERADYYAVVYESHGVPGKFKFYNRRMRRRCYMEGRREHKHIRTGIRGRFTAYWPTNIDPIEYDKLKDEGWDAALNDSNPGDYSIDRLRLGAVLRYLRDIRGDKWQSYPKGMGTRTICQVLSVREGLKLSRDVIRELQALPKPGMAAEAASETPKPRENPVSEPVEGG